MRTTRIQSDAKNLLFDCIPNKLVCCYARSAATTYTFLGNFLSSLLKCELFSLSSLSNAEHELSPSSSLQESDKFSFSHFFEDHEETLLAETNNKFIINKIVKAVASVKVRKI